MKHTSILAGTMFAVCLFGTQARAQQEVDPTPYPLPQTAQYKPGHPASPRTVKQSSTHATHATAKKTPKTRAASKAHKDAPKTVAQR
jgi:hypothetical protein